MPRLERVDEPRNEWNNATLPARVFGRTDDRRPCSLRDSNPRGRREPAVGLSMFDGSVLSCQASVMVSASRSTMSQVRPSASAGRDFLRAPPPNVTRRVDRPLRRGSSPHPRRIAPVLATHLPGTARFWRADRPDNPRPQRPQRSCPAPWVRCIVESARPASLAT